MRKVNWYRVKAPQPWRPKLHEELIGTYLCTKQKIGEWGPYSIHLVKSRCQIFYVSGAMVDNLFGLLQPETKVKLIFTGMRDSPGGRSYKTFELYTDEALKIAEVG